MTTFINRPKVENVISPINPSCLWALEQYLGFQTALTVIGLGTDRKGAKTLLELEVPTLKISLFSFLVTH